MFKTWLKKNEIKINKIDMTPTPARENEKRFLEEKIMDSNLKKEKRTGVGNMGEQRTGIALSESAKVQAHQQILCFGLICVTVYLGRVSVTMIRGQGLCAHC